MTFRRSPPASALLVCLLALSFMLSAALLMPEASAAEAKAPFELCERLLADADDGRLDQFSFLAGALIASGVQEQAALERYLAAFEQHAAAALAEAAHREPAARCEQLFDYLHERFLTGAYDAHWTELDRTLADGGYNCVTATVLYCALCRAAGVDAEAVAAPGHVFAQITLEGEPTEVETTCAGWFSLLDDAQREQALAERRGESAADERVLTDVELIGKIFYNRGVFHLEAERHAEAIALIRLGLRLDARDRAARANLLAAFNNWALAECRRENWREAARLIEAGLRIDPHYEALLANELHACHGWAMELCRLGRYAEAIELLEEGYRRRPEAPLFDEGRFAVYRSWVESLLRQGRHGEAREVLARASTVDARRAATIRLRLGA